MCGTVEVGVNPRVERSQLYVEQLVTQVAQTAKVAARVLLPQISHQPVSTYDITYVGHCTTVTQSTSIYLSILWAGAQPTLDPYAEAFIAGPLR